MSDNLKFCTDPKYLLLPVPPYYLLFIYRVIFSEPLIADHAEISFGFSGACCEYNFVIREAHIKPKFKFKILSK
jgi:hypothetical protein